MTRSITAIFIAAVLVVAVTAPAGAQVPYFSTEYYVVPDYRTVTSGNFSWDNWVLEDTIGALHTITWDGLTQMGTGVHGGQLFPTGAYEVEAIWLSTNFGNGIVGGHSHFVTTGGNPGTYDRSHYNGTPDQLQGWRVSRTDGAGFSLKSLDFLSVPCGLLVGTSFVDYASTCIWDQQGVAQGIVLSNSTWMTIQFFDIPNPGLPPVLPGQPVMPGIAVFDIAGAVNANGAEVNDVCGDFGGPFTVTLNAGSSMDMSFAGEPSRPILVLGSVVLNVNAVTLMPFGQLDIGTTNPLAPFIPTDIFLFANGFMPDFFNSLFNTGPSGVADFSFPVPSFPTGTTVALQALIYHASTGPLIPQVSNAIEITFM